MGHYYSFMLLGKNPLLVYSLDNICYIVSPLYKKYVDSRYSTFLLPCILAVFGVGLAYLFPKYEIVISRLPIFFLGFHLAKLDNLGEAKCSLNPWGMMLLSILILYAMSFLNWPMRWLRLLYFVVSIPMLISFASIMSFMNSIIKRVLDFFGRHTLELYLVHESICTTIVWKYYHENVYIYALLCLVMAVPLAVIVKQASNRLCAWIGIHS